MVEIERPYAASTLPLVIHREGEEELHEWVGGQRETLEGELLGHGGILFRGFDVLTPAGFEALIGELYGEAMEYRDRAAHRSRVSGRIYTATDYPPEYDIFLHNESSYAFSFPRRLLLHCVEPSKQGGQTPIADVRKVYERLDPAVRKRFEERGVLYVRNFGNAPFGPSWQTAFQTTDRAEMEQYCRESGIEVEWLGPDRVRTRQVRSATARHPVTGEIVWFNHAAVLHVSTLSPRLRKSLSRLLKDEDLPSNSYYGDGSPIEPDVLDAIRDAYRAETVLFEWKPGDVLLLDNLLAAHGRRPFTGPRNVLVGMAQPLTWEQIEVSDGVA